MDHHNGGGATASYSGLRIATTAAAARPACTSRASATSRKREEKFTRGYGYEVYTNRGNWTRGIDSADFGADFKNEITRPGEWSLFMEGYGETLPYHDNRMWLSPDNRIPGECRRIQRLDELPRQRKAPWRSR